MQSQPHSLPAGLAMFIALLCGAGGAFVMWRTVVAPRTGSIWLRGQKAVRSEDPFWFWVYLAAYLLIISVMIYGVLQALVP